MIGDGRAFDAPPVDSLAEAIVLAALVVHYESNRLVREELVDALFRLRRRSWAPVRQATHGYVRWRRSARGGYYTEYRRRIA